MGELDEDGRPVRGAGALPFAGGGMGVGDKSGVSFSRNILEQPPRTEPRGKFMIDFAKLVADAATGRIAQLEQETITPKYQTDFTREPTAEDQLVGTVVFPKHPPLDETPEEKAQRRLETRKELKAEQRARWRANAKAKREAKRNGAGRVPDAEVSKQDVREKAGEVEVSRSKQGRGVSRVRVSGVSRDGGDVDPAVPAVREGAPAGAEAVQPQLTDPQKEMMLRAAVLTAALPFHINVAQVLAMPLDQVDRVIGDLRAQTAALMDAVQKRREQEGSKSDDPSRCQWCKEPFTNGRYYNRFPFELEPGSGIYNAAIYSCNKGSCLKHQENAASEVLAQLKAERAG